MSKVQPIRKSVLTVEFDPDMAAVRQAVLATARYQVITAESAEMAYEFCGARHFDVVVFGASVPRDLKRELARRLAEISPGIPIVSLSGQPGDDGQASWAEINNLESPTVLLDAINSMLEDAAA